MSYKRKRLNYEILSNNIKTKRDVAAGVSAASHLFANDPNKTGWFSISIPDKGSLVQHSFLVKIQGTTLMVADINGSACYRRPEHNLFYKPLIDGIIAYEGLSKHPVFLSNEDHEDAVLHATQEGPSDGGCSQYCEYLTENNLF